MYGRDMQYTSLNNPFNLLEADINRTSPVQSSIMDSHDTARNPEQRYRANLYTTYSCL
jgi:hypothetical protein